MNARRLLVVCALAAIGMGDAGLAGADTLYLKDGRKLAAPIRQRTDRAVTLDWYGVPVTYWLNEIERIEPGDPETAEASLTPAAAPVPAAAAAPAVPAPSAPRPAPAMPAAKVLALPTQPPIVRRAPVPPALPARGRPDPAADLIDEILQRSGMLEQLAHARPLIEDRLAQHDDAQPSPAPDRMVRDALARAFSASALAAVVRARFLKTAEPYQDSAVLGWLRSPQAQRMIAYELGAASPSAGDVGAFAAELQAHQPGERRLQLIRRLNAATHASEDARAVNLAVADAVLRVLDPSTRTTASGRGLAQDSAPRADAEGPRALPVGLHAADPAHRRPAGWNAELEQIRAQSEGLLSHQTELYFLFAYRAVSDDALEAYIRFWESELGRTFHARSTAALLESLTEAGEAAARDVQAAGGGGR